MILPGESPGSAICSRAGCTTAAAHRIDWRNPRIHASDRVKTWLACDAHVDHLRDFLAARDFPVRVVDLASRDLASVDPAPGERAVAP